MVDNIKANGELSNIKHNNIVTPFSRPMLHNQSTTTKNVTN